MPPLLGSRYNLFALIYCLAGNIFFMNSSSSVNTETTLIKITTLSNAKITTGLITHLFRLLKNSMPVIRRTEAIN